MVNVIPIGTHKDGGAVIDLGRASDCHILITGDSVIIGLSQAADGSQRAAQA